MSKKIYTSEGNGLRFEIEDLGHELQVYLDDGREEACIIIDLESVKELQLMCRRILERNGK